MIENKIYYVDLIHSSKANKFTSRWHYSGVGFKKAKINLGIYRKVDNLLVGVLQWGVSAQEGIRLDRYIKEPLDKATQYLELNRFCMADSEGKNAESQAISLGIKWIKQNRPDIKLLVSYAGRKEGNYGYIYQATNWEYLGYFVSSGFWLLDGVEKHQITLWHTYQKHGDLNKTFREAICELYHDVRQTWTKQFIYIKRLDKSLHVANPVLPYPKPANEFPICTKVKIYKEDDDFLINQQELLKQKEKEPVTYYYEKETELFTRRAMYRKGEIVKTCVAVYDGEGCLEDVYKTIKDASEATNISQITVSRAIKSGKYTKGFFFRQYPITEENPAEKLAIDSYICKIDNLMFFNQTQVADYCGVSRQAVSTARARQAKEINGKKIEWKEAD